MSFISVTGTSSSDRSSSAVAKKTAAPKKRKSKPCLMLSVKALVLCHYVSDMYFDIQESRAVAGRTV